MLDGVCARTARPPREPGAQARRDSGHRGVGRRGPHHAVARMFGLGPVVSGRIRIKHFEGGFATPGTRIAQGVGFLSEDRKTEGLALDRSIEDNVTLFVAQAACPPRLAAAQRATCGGGTWLERLACECHGPGAERRRDFPAATSRRWRWRGCFTSRRTFCFSTSRRAGSTSGPRPRSTD